MHFYDTHFFLPTIRISKQGVDFTEEKLVAYFQQNWWSFTSTSAQKICPVREVNMATLHFFHNIKG